MITQYRADVDGLRAVAVGGVVLFHAWPELLPGGFVGVDVFFVLSGFLITAIIRSEAEAGTFSIAGFYERRFRRILPALAAVVVATSAAALVILPPGELAAYGRSLVGVALFASNIAFWRESGYFDTAAHDKPLLHTWSLAVEEQFYIVWPLIAVALVALGRRRLLALFVWAAVVGSLLAAEVAVRISPSQAFYMLPYRAWELGFGALLAVGAVPAFRGPRLREAAAFAGLLLILAPMLLYSEATRFPGLSAVPPCLGALLLIHAGQGHATAVGRALSLRPIVYVGLVSYSFYLWHWPLLVLPRIALDRSLNVTEAALAVAAAFALAALSLRFVEKPFRGRGTFRMSRAQVLTAGAASFALLGAAGIVAWRNEGFIGFASPRVLAAEKAVASFNPWRDACHQQSRNTRSSAARCTGGVADGRAGYDVLLLGDSHADHLMPGLSGLAKERGFEVRQATVSGCSPVSIFLKYGEHDAACPNLYRRALAEAGRSPDLDAVVMSARWSAVLPAIVENEPGRDERAAVARFGRTLRRIVALARREVGPDVRIVVVGTTPEFDFWPATCLARAAKVGRDEARCRTARPTDAHWGPLADRAIASLRGRGVDVVLLRDGFCDDTAQCRTAADDVVLYRDDDHLTRQGSTRVARRLADALRGAG